MTSENIALPRVKRPVKFGVVLAGGQSRRMAKNGNAADKAMLELGGRRLVDHVLQRLRPQVDQMLIAGPDDYGTQFKTLPDRYDGPKGPVAALWSVAKWLSGNAPETAGFFTVPVDGPFLPEDLVVKLTSSGQCAVAASGDRLHPTFAYWQVEPLLDVLSAAAKGEGLALHWVAEQCQATPVKFQPPHLLMNINTRNDLARAEEILKADEKPTA